ncbi:choline kinase family protein [Oricola cellulosilytica]|uniref:Choline kinase n=1 Tax=Oricola cellulosilytica TaxID=1429082 RepID=A0A4R0P9H1_9HYPH|nr:choline kinase family protein [Oricola cellulosilytica]TCD13811.1 choline kinase [Oricola cellulosilytica]
MSGPKRIAALPCWKGSVDMEPLTGGLSNESWLVTDAAGRHVVRFGKDYPFHHVIRERELLVARAAHAAGFSPAVEYAESGVMVSAFLEARTWTEEDMRAQPERIARLLHDFHHRMPSAVSGPGFMFWVFHVIRDYARTLAAGGSRHATDLPEYLRLAAELEEAQVPLPIIFGHNDLLPGNFLDDGERLWLIDFEYAGFNTAMFDLAGAASNSGMDEETAECLLAGYFGRASETALKRSFDAMQCASLLREAMWAMVSELHLSAPGVDYAAYARENLARLFAALDRYHSRHGKS